jgi:hypothetical protein
MSKPDSKELFKENQVIVVQGRPALITNIGGDGTVPNSSTINYAFVNGEGGLETGGHFHAWEPGVQHVDFAKVRTVVELPPEWQERAIEYDKEQQANKKLSPVDDYEPEEHPSYGTVQVHRCSGHASLFMSPFRHQNYIALSIHRASLHRSCANDRTYSTRALVEVDLSEAQWARLVSSAGQGEGTPCTINRIGGESMPECPEQMEVEKFHKDTDRLMAKSAASLSDAIKDMRALMDKPSVTKAERKAMLDKLNSAQQALTDGLPFVATQIRERMEHVVSEGKTEIEAFFQQTVQKLGMNQLQGSPIDTAKLAPALPPKPEEPEKH